MKLSLIVALDERGAIGRKNDLPWKLPRDLKRFRELTRGHHVIMGRKTYESILNSLGKPLPDRMSLVLSRNEGRVASAGNELGEQVKFFTTREALLQYLSLQSDANPFVIGGEKVYREFLDLVSTFFVTHVGTRVVDGDAFFPIDALSSCPLLSEEFIPRDEKNEFDMRFCIYERNPK